MKKYIIGSFVAITLFVGVAQAQTVDNTELINRLLKQLAELTAIVQRLQAQQNMQGPAYGFKGDVGINNSVTAQGAFSASARFVENSQDKVGIWDVFKAGKGNASSITADWAWDITFYNNTDKLRHIKKISVLHEPTGEGWSTDYEKMYNRANGYPLLVTSSEGKTLETKYVGDIDIEIDSKSQKTFRLYGQPEGRTYKEATVWIYFADGSATSVRAGRSGMVESPITVISEPGQPVRIITDNTVYPRNVVVLPGKEELLFAVGVNTNMITYATTLEVRFDKVSGSGFFSDYTDRVDLVDRFNKTISAEGSVSYDGNTTIYKFTKLNHKIQTYGEHFYVKVKTKSDMDKSGKFTMSVPKDGLKLEGQTLSGTVTNTITFDPSYTLKKNETTVAQSYVRVITPNNGGIFNNNETLEIKYETNLNSTNSEGVTLQLYKTTKTSGSVWQPVLTIASKLKSGKYLWQIPKDLPEGEYNIYAVGQGVWAQGSSIGDFSDKSFTIKPATGMGI